VPAKRSTDFHLRISPGELRAWRRAARAADEPVSQWVRKICNLSAVPSPPPVPPVVSGDQVELPFKKGMR
jgi:hypothetical protein